MMSDGSGGGTTAGERSPIRITGWWAITRAGDQDACV
jgi:hypothetical protein